MTEFNPYQPITHDFVVNQLPIRNHDTYKNQLGHVLCIGGDMTKGGAIILCAMAAVYSGSGLVSVASHPDNKTSLHSILPEAMFCDYTDNDAIVSLIHKASSVVIGPGLGLDASAKHLLTTTLQNVTHQQSLIIDADALTLLSQMDIMLSECPATLIMTPHAGEWKRLTGADIHDDLTSQHYQAVFNALLVLKGAPSKVVTSSNIWINTAGNPSQATGGMGDCLAGIIAGFQSQYHKSTANLNRHEIALLSAVYLHSYTADYLAQEYYVTLPTAIIKELPKVMRKLIEDK